MAVDLSDINIYRWEMTRPVLFGKIFQIACELNGAVKNAVLSTETYQHDLSCTVDRFSLVTQGPEGEYARDIRRYNHR
jgi:hypothetical protein